MERRREDFKREDEYMPIPNDTSAAHTKTAYLYSSLTVDKNVVISRYETKRVDQGIWGSGAIQ